MTDREMSGHELKPGKPLVAMVGGPLLHTRLDLFEELRGEFDIVGIGASDQARAAFEDRHLPFWRIRLGRGIDPFGDLVAYREMRRIFRLLRPAVVHAYQGKPAIWGRLAAHKENVPVIVGSIEGLGFLYSTQDAWRRAPRKFYEILQRHACRASQATVFQNESDRDYFVERRIEAMNHTVLIPGLGIRTGFFDPERFAGLSREPLRRELRIAPNATLVTMVTRLLRSKGVGEFARAESVRAIPARWRRRPRGFRCAQRQRARNTQAIRHTGGPPAGHRRDPGRLRRFRASEQVPRGHAAFDIGGHVDVPSGRDHGYHRLPRRRRSRPFGLRCSAGRCGGFGVRHRKVDPRRISTSQLRPGGPPAGDRAILTPRDC